MSILMMLKITTEMKFTKLIDFYYQIKKDFKSSSIHPLTINVERQNYKNENKMHISRSIDVLAGYICNLLEN